MIKIEDLAKSYGTKVLFENINYHFPEGERIALVGRNGAGKSTFLNILCGMESSDHGQLVSAKGATIGFLPQEPNPNPKSTCLMEVQSSHEVLYRLSQTMQKQLAEMEVQHSTALLEKYETTHNEFMNLGGYEIEAKSKAVLSGLGFSDEKLRQNPTELSGGWRMRLELAKLFLQDFAMLILDEPTNHLDLPSLVWVESYLQNFEGIVLFVSHDRDLLNRLASVVLHLEQGDRKSVV